MTIHDAPGGRFTPQAVVAMAVIALGLIKTADNLGWIEAGSMLRFWPIALVAIGVTLYSRAVDRPARVTGGLLIALGGWMTIGRAFGMQISLFSLWPLALVAIGITMILAGSGRQGTDVRAPDLGHRVLVGREAPRQFAGLPARGSARRSWAASRSISGRRRRPAAKRSLICSSCGAASRSRSRPTGPSSNQ